MDVESSTKQGVSLAAKISSALRRDLAEGVFRPGDRLPSESALTREYSVSRTVVREAIAILRADGLVEARKGAGVFAVEVKPAKELPFNDLAVGRISSVIELLELRTVFEVESAGLAASRRSAVQVEAIVDAHRRVGDCLAAGLPTRDADFEFHLAIAQATQNRRFPEFLQLIRSGIIPRGELQGQRPGRVRRTTTCISRRSMRGLSMPSSKVMPMPPVNIWRRICAAVLSATRCFCAHALPLNEPEMA